MVSHVALLLFASNMDVYEFIDPPVVSDYPGQPGDPVIYNVTVKNYSAVVCVVESSATAEGQRVLSGVLCLSTFDDRPQVTTLLPCSMSPLAQ